MDAALATDRYLDLLEKTLTDYHRHELGEYQHISQVYGASATFKFGHTVDKWMKKINPKYGICRFNAFKPENRLEGKDWPAYADTMVGLKRLQNVRQCAEEVIRENVPGDFMETGVWRGGTAIYMRALLEVHDVTDRVVWAADSFEGLPVPDAAKYSADAGDVHHQYKELAIGIEQVKHNFKKYDLLDDQVKFLKGWFKDTMPTAPVQKLALLRLDGDMYESTMDVLKPMYPKLSVGGYCIIDDYALEGCRKAVDEYRAEHGITAPLQKVDWTGMYWKKER